MRVVVAICTWNRAQLLDQTLTQFAQLRIPDGVSWELLVVNNNSSDHTDQVIAKHTSSLPLRRLLESRQGHCHARNCAMDAAQGELLLWTDDDVLIDPEWLASYVEAARQWPDVAFFGGPIAPWFAKEPPAWITRHLDKLGGVWALLDYGVDTHPLEPQQLPYGANMAMRLEIVQERRFDTRLGRVGTEMMSDDETTFFRNLVRVGHTGVWVGSARVEHYIPSDRLTISYLSRFFYGLGRGCVVTTETEVARRVLGIPLWLLKKYLGNLISRLFAVNSGTESWVNAIRNEAATRGMVYEYFSLHRKQRSGGQTGDR